MKNAQEPAKTAAYLENHAHERVILIIGDKNPGLTIAQAVEHFSKKGINLEFPSGKKTWQKISAQLPENLVPHKPDYVANLAQEQSVPNSGIIGQKRGGGFVFAKFGRPLEREDLVQAVAA